MTEQCVGGGARHDWRHIKTTEATEYAPEPLSDTSIAKIPRAVQVTISDEWYCTRCRKIEVTDRG